MSRVRGEGLGLSLPPKAPVLLSVPVPFLAPGPLPFSFPPPGCCFLLSPEAGSSARSGRSPALSLPAALSPACFLSHSHSAGGTVRGASLLTHFFLLSWLPSFPGHVSVS